MIRFVLTLVCLIGLNSALCQEIAWEQSYGGLSEDYAMTLEETDDGGFVVAGDSESDSIDVSGNNGSDDVWVYKVDSEGHMIWEENYGGSGNDFANAIKQTDDGGFIVAGVSTSDDGDVSGNYGGQDYWVLKLDSLGNLKWEQNYGGTQDDYAYTVHQTHDQGFIVGGYSHSSAWDVGDNYGESDCWLIKLDSAGELLWEQNYGGHREEYLYSVAPTRDSGFALAGRTNSSSYDVSSRHGKEDFWIIKVNNRGQLEWEETYGGSEYDAAWSVQQTHDGSFIVLGDSESSDQDVSGNNGNIDVWALKLDSARNIEWEANYGGSSTDYSYTVRQTRDSNFVLGGQVRSSDKDIAEAYNGYDFWVLKVDEGGSILWENTYGGNARDKLFALAVTDNQEIIAGGMTGSSDGDVSGNKGRYDSWILKIREADPASSLQLSNHEVIVYPNPAYDRLQIASESPIQGYRIYAITGKIVQAGPLQGKEEAVSIRKLSPGSYMIAVETSEDEILKKLLVR